MFKVSVEQTDGNKITPVKGDTLEAIAASDRCEPGTTWQHLALYNWGTTEPHEVNRALIELVGCSKVDDAAPEKSVLDPELGTTKALHVPKAWKPAAPLALEKTHTLKVRRRLPPPAAVLTKLEPWFIPETESCDADWRIEGVELRADKLDFDVYASNYCKVTATADEEFFTFAYAPVDVPIVQKRAFVPSPPRAAGSYTGWKGESEAADGMLKPRSGQKRHVNVACSPYTVQLRYYKGDGDKDARITLKPFWPRYKPVYKNAADTTGIDGTNAGGPKGATTAAWNAARKLAIALQRAARDAEALFDASERAAVRAHATAKAAQRAMDHLASARDRLLQSRNDIAAARTAAQTNAPNKVALRDTAGTTTTDAHRLARTAEATAKTAADALAVAKVAAANARAKADAARTSAQAAATEAATAKTKADEALAACAAPQELKSLAEAAVKAAAAAKTAVDAHSAAAGAAAPSATSCSSDADTASGTADGALADARTMVTSAKTSAERFARAQPGDWTGAGAEADTGRQRADGARTTLQTAQTQARTLQAAADAARLDAEKLKKSLAEASKTVAALEDAADATDAQVVFDKSLEVKWKVEKTAKLKHGQLLIVDAAGKPVFRKPLAAADLAQDTEVTCKPADDDQAKYWLDEKSKLDLAPAGMPYRVQIQAHSAWTEDEGVALVAMQTEVRLWAHADTGRRADPLQDPPSLKLGLAPWRPEKDPPADGSHEWYKLKLAELGYNPGPVNPRASTGPNDPYQIALAEFQRSFPREETAPYTRLVCDGAPNGPSQTVLARTDVADRALAKTEDAKAETKAALDAANAAKAAAEKTATDAAAAQTTAAQAATLAAEAAAAAQQAVTDAEAARSAADAAKSAVDAAADAEAAAAADAGGLALSARTAVGTAKGLADQAAASAAAAQAKAAAAKQATTTGEGLAKTAKDSGADTVTKVDGAKTKATAADTKATQVGSPGTVTTNTALAVARAGTAETSAATAKGATETAATSSDAAKTAANTADTAAAQAKSTADTLAANAAPLQAGLQAGPVAPHRAAAGTLATDAAAAKAAADQADTDARALTTRADQAKADADQAKTDADTAKNDAVALAAAAKDADDAAEADRQAKAQRKAAVDGVMRPSLAMFGNPADRSDLSFAQAKTSLADKNAELIVWLDDCNYYTSGSPYPDIAMLDYRGGMSIGDGKVAKDKLSIPRPWIPLEADLPLLAKGQALAASGNPPAVTDAMRRAIGPVRVDWTFDELPPDVSPIQPPSLAKALPIARFNRSATVKQKTALLRVAAGEAKAAAEPPQTQATAAETELKKVVDAAPELVALCEQAETHVAAAKGAVDTAVGDTTAAEGDGARGAAALAACQDAAAKAATAMQSATAAAAKAATAKAAAEAAATAAAQAKADLATLADRLKTLGTRLDDAQNAAAIAASEGAVSGPLGQCATLLAEATRQSGEAKPHGDSADTEAARCRADAAAASTAAELLKTHAQAMHAAAVQAASQAAGGAWAQARAAAGTGATAGADAQAAAGPAKTSAETLKTTANAAKPPVDQVKTDAPALKAAVEAIEPEAISADTQAEAERLAREGASTAAAGQTDPSLLAARGNRPRAHVESVLGTAGAGREVDGKLYTNAPITLGGADCGGLRPDVLDTYYKAAFGIDKPGSNRPWLVKDDNPNKVVFSVAHDDLGQDAAKVFAPYRGKAGVFLNPSRIAGDGYRYRAQVSFRKEPGDTEHPNHEALQARYVRPPAAHTAGLRLWRKASMRGYVGWMPAPEAGWEDTSREMGSYYGPAHVHFMFEGDNPGTPQEFTPVGNGANDLITAAQFQSLVDTQLAGSPYAGKSAQYQAGYVWPFLHLDRWGIEHQWVSLQTFVNWLYGTIEETSWDLYSKQLILKLIEGSEQKHGQLRGHLVAEFKSSPPVIVLEYTCNGAGKHRFTEVANRPAGSLTETVDGQTVNYHQRSNTTTCPNCPSGSGKTFTRTNKRVIKGGIPLCAIGRPLGGCWLYTPRNAPTWAHEVGHHRHLQHAQADGSDVTIAPGGQVTQHDSQANPFQASQPSAFQRAWDRWCIMSYDDQGPVAFCGKCLLKNRGWAVQTIADPAPEVQDA